MNFQTFKNNSVKLEIIVLKSSKIVSNNFILISEKPACFLLICLLFTNKTTRNPLTKGPQSGIIGTLSEVLEAC